MFDQYKNNLLAFNTDGYPFFSISEHHCIGYFSLSSAGMRIVFDSKFREYAAIVFIQLLL